MACGEKRDLDAVDVHPFADFGFLPRLAEPFAEAQGHDGQGLAAGHHRAVAGPGVIGMRMGDERARNRAHRIDVEIAGRAIEAFRARMQQFGCFHGLACSPPVKSRNHRDMSSAARSASLTQGSGDLIADRRFAYAEGALADGDAVAAFDLYEQTLERVPAWLPARLGLGKAALALGREAEARGAFEVWRRGMLTICSAPAPFSRGSAWRAAR